MKLEHEPAITSGAVVALVEAFIVMSVMLGWFALSNEQLAAVMTFVGALVAILAPLAGSFYTRQRVFPMSKLTVVNDDE